VALSVELEWGAAGARALGAHCDVLIVVDVLSFSSAVDVAVGRGASVLPFPRYNASATRFATQHGALLASSRRGGTAEQPYSLSPATLLTIPRGARLVLPSLNGSAISSAAASSGGQVVAGCLRNASAVAAAVRDADSIGVVAAGERWRDDGTLRVAFEDLMGAGAIIARLPCEGWSPEARAAAAAFGDASAELQQRILACPSGRELTEQGFDEDVRLAAALDDSGSAPRLVDGIYCSGA
jgi:2-phosphosulfolactate phosphatase